MSQPSRGSRRPGFRRAVGALCALLALGAVAPGPVAAGPEQTKQELERARRRADALKDELREAQAHQEAVAAELHVITVRVSQATAQAEALAAAIYQTRHQIRRTGDRIDNLQSTIDARARAAYMAGPGAALELIFEADSLSDLSERLVFLEVLNDRDSAIATGLQVERRQLTYKRSDLDELLEDQQALLAELEGEQAVLLAKQEEAIAARTAFEDKLEEARNLIERLEERYQRELRAAILAARRAAAPYTGNIGPLPSADGPFFACPVDPPRSYVDDFGAPRVGHTHQGNDIFAPTGTPIRAPFAGVAEEGYDGLGGIIVHVYASANADYVYNAHLSQHAGVDGQHVQPGDLIGYVGNTGNAVGTSPHDHFEYHPGGGSAVSPYVYLNEVCGVGGAG